MPHGYVLNSGNLVSFDVPGKDGTLAQGINASRQIVGFYFESGTRHGYVADTRGSNDPATWSFTLVNVPNSSQTVVRGIDSGGNLVGYYVDGTGTHGFLARPIP